MIRIKKYIITKMAEIVINHIVDCQHQEKEISEGSLHTIDLILFDKDNGVNVLRAWIK